MNTTSSISRMLKWRIYTGWFLTSSSLLSCMLWSYEMCIVVLSNAILISWSWWCRISTNASFGITELERSKSNIFNEIFTTIDNNHSMLLCHFEFGSVFLVAKKLPFQHEKVYGKRDLFTVISYFEYTHERLELWDQVVMSSSIYNRILRNVYCGFVSSDPHLTKIGFCRKSTKVLFGIAGMFFRQQTLLGLYGLILLTISFQWTDMCITYFWIDVCETYSDVWVQQSAEKYCKEFPEQLSSSRRIWNRETGTECNHRKTCNIDNKNAARLRHEGVSFVMKVWKTTQSCDWCSWCIFSRSGYYLEYIGNTLTF